MYKTRTSCRRNPPTIYIYIWEREAKCRQRERSGKNGCRVRSIEYLVTKKKYIRIVTDEAATRGWDPPRIDSRAQNGRTRSNAFAGAPHRSARRTARRGPPSVSGRRDRSRQYNSSTTSNVSPDSARPFPLTFPSRVRSPVVPRYKRHLYVLLKYFFSLLLPFHTVDVFTGS